MKGFDEAFEKIEPKTDAERERLQRLREKISEGRKEMEAQFANLRMDLKLLRADKTSEYQERVATDTKANERLDQEVMDLLTEQAALIDRIAGRGA